MPDKSELGQFVWHELLTTDPAAAIAFYSKVAGWEKTHFDPKAGYTMLGYKGVPVAGTMKIPAEAAAMGTPPSWTTYIGTGDLEVTAWEAQRLGAKVLKGPEKAPGIGSWVVLKDPQGAVFGVHQPEDPRKAGTGKPGMGDFSWHELATTDHKAAFAFYRELFGWKHAGSADMGPPLGEYLMFGNGKGKDSCGGMYTKAADQPGPPAWLPYIRVPDAKATVAATEPRGGKIIVPPMEVPGGDWITMGMDPQGAMFATHSIKEAARPSSGKKVTGSTARKAKPAKTRSAKKAAGKKAARKPAAKAAKKGKSTTSRKRKAKRR